MSRKVFSWIFRNGKGSFLIMFAMSLLCCGQSLISLKFVSISKNLINIATGQQSGDLVNAAILLILFLLLLLIVQISVNFLNVHASSRMEIALKRHIFDIILKKEYLSITKYHSGELLNRLNSDISVIVSGIMTILPSAILFLTSIIGAFIYLFNIDNVLALIILCIGPFVFLGARLYSKKYKSLHKQCQEADGKTKSFMLEIIQNLLVVKSFCNSDRVLSKSEDFQKNSYRLRVHRTKVSIVAHTGMFLIFNAGYYFTIAYGAYRIATGKINFGEFMSMTMLVNQIQTPFKNISSLVPQFFSVIASVERLIELENVVDEPDKKLLTDVDSLYKDMSEIVFDKVKFSYNANSEISIDMHIKKGECTVIGGESGVGKSTAIKMLLSIFQPDSGEIYINADNKKIPVDTSTRPLFSYVPQGNLILSGTIRDNITFASGDADEADIIKSAKIACIWEFIEKLEDGLDTVIGEKGLGLSEGQAQRISIARAMLYNAPILLLDESTSALDSETETKLLNNIRNMTDKTCIIISHKKAAFDICDNVEYVTKNVK